MTNARIVTLVLLSAMLAGCGTPLKQHFYTLRASADHEPAATASGDFSVTVGPVTVPDMVDRPQFVLRAAANRVILAEQARWAEPLRSEISYVIADNLRRLLTGVRVLAHPQYANSGAGYRVVVNVQRFDSVLGEAATVEAAWSVSYGVDGAAQGGRSVVREPTGGNSYDDLVAAHGRALAAVSRDIAEAIRSAAASR